MRRRCFVCGFGSDEPICPRCNTILRPDQAVCTSCGKAFDGWIADCDACGASVGLSQADPDQEDAIRSLASVPGISRAQAKDLASKGFRTFAELVRVALPENAVRRGVHHAIARKMTMAKLAPRPGSAADGEPCPTCGATSIANQARCPVCGSSFDRGLDRAALEQTARGITGEVRDLSLDADFRSMPEKVRNEFLEASYGSGTDASRVGEGPRPIETSLRNGLSVESPDGMASGKSCPLCEVRLDGTADECGNCGARFA